MKKNIPEISVIIPTYNRAAFIADAIDSVLNQDFKKFELIVVDDGSTDDTSEILKRYEGQIKVLRQKNSGVSAARNRGVEISTGRYIALLDSDDYWMPGKLSAQAEFFAANPDAHICQTEEIWVRNGKRVNPKVKHKKPRGDIFLKSLALCLISPSAVMMTRAVLDEVGLFDESMIACEDYDLWLRISAKYPAHLIDKPFLVKRGGHEDQLSSAPGLDKFRIYSLERLIRSRSLTKEKAGAAFTILKQKCEIFAGGCAKRGRIIDEAHYKRLPVELYNDYFAGDILFPGE